jgi:hypothetical protein
MPRWWYFVSQCPDRFPALNALEALFVVGPLVAAWLFRPALGPTATERAEAGGLDVLTPACDRPWRKDRTNE